MNSPLPDFNSLDFSEPYRAGYLLRSKFNENSEIFQFRKNRAANYVNYNVQTPNRFRVGQKLIAKYPNSLERWCFATINQVYKNKISITFDLEFGKSFWVIYNSTKIKSYYSFERNYIQPPICYGKCFGTWEQVKLHHILKYHGDFAEKHLFE